MEPLGAAIAAVVVGTLLLSALVLRSLDRTDERWRDRLRERFVWGVPWGTLVVSSVVLAVYLFVQDGITDLTNPVSIPFRAWSYLYPLGIVTAPFSHASLSHLVGNLSGTLVLAPIVEYAWGHYPREGDSTTVGRWRRGPWIRAVIVFPLVVIGVGVLTSAFAFGPVIGFSGVVFAFAGIALVRYPIATLVAILGGQSVLTVIVAAVRSPIVVATTEASPPAPPSWATIAIQGHAFGLFVGILLGIALLRRREITPDPIRLWLSLLVFAIAQGLWQIYWYGGEGVYVLFTGPGVAIVVALALLVTLAITASERSVVPERVARLLGVDRPGAVRVDSRPLELATAAVGGEDRFGDRVRAIATGSRSLAAGRDAFLTRRSAAFIAVLVVFATIAGPAIPLNLFVLGDTGTAEATITVEDYAVTYDEGVENRLISAVPVDAFREETAVEESGVLVWSEERQVWLTAVTTDSLAYAGERSIDLGGPGWRTSVTAEREGWSPVGNDTAYQVWLRSGDEPARLAYASEPSRADVTVTNATFSIVPNLDDDFGILVDDGETEETVAVPAENESVAVNGVSIHRTDGRLYASTDETTVPFATEETGTRS